MQSPLSSGSARCGLIFDHQHGAEKTKNPIDKITKSAANVMNKFEAIDGGVKTVAEKMYRNYV